MRATLLSASALLAASVPAQSFHLPSDTPATGACDPLPLAGDVRYQVLIPPADLGGAPCTIRGFAVAPCAAATQAFGRILVRMAHRRTATLSTTFDQNLAAGATTVLDAWFFVWPLSAGVWNELDLRAPFAFNGADHLVVDVITAGATANGPGLRRDATHACVHRAGYTGEATGVDGGRSAIKMKVIAGDAGAHVFGSGCHGANGVPKLAFHGNGALGTTLVVTGTIAALGPTPATLWIGTAALPVPFDLTPFGGFGCRVDTWPVVSVATPMQMGVAWLTLPIPNDPGLAGLALYCQWQMRDRSVPLGFTTSDYGRVRLGR
jgi:hypothetical protein